MKVRIANYEFKPTLVPSLAFMLLLPVLVSLGLWQLDRAEEKRQIERDVKEATEKPPLLINIENPESLLSEVYRPAEVRGYFDNQRQYLWDNKTNQGRPGYQVVTPFVVEGSSQILMVNRGWVPMLGHRDQLPDIKVSTEIVRINGVIKNPSNTIQLADRVDQKNMPYPHVIQAFEPSVMAAELGTQLMPVMLELSPEDENGYVRHWQPYFGKIGKHLGYAAQWFIMALIVVFLYLKLNTKRVDSDLQA